VFARAVDIHGDTALMIASRNGFSDAVTALLACPVVAASAEHVKNNCGLTAHMIAVMYEHADVVRALRVDV
jgi:ankyrin repeat protein